MPRQDVESEGRLEWLSIVDEQGRVDEELLPGPGDELLLALYRAMVLSRRFDERRLQLQVRGCIGTFAPAIGQEAAQLGAISALGGGDRFVPGERGSPMMLWCGAPMSGMLLDDAGYRKGAELLEGSRAPAIAVPVCAQLPDAAGGGYAAWPRGVGGVVLVSFTHGATSEGDVLERVRFAVVHRSPVVFLCQNTRRSVSTFPARETGSPASVQKALADGIPGIVVDGNDLLAVHLATREAVERARSGEGPTLIEAVTCRLPVHATGDDPSTSRDARDQARGRRRDPIERFRRFLRDRGALDDERVDMVEREVLERIEEAWERARHRLEELGDPVALFDHIYAETRPPSTISARRP